MTNYKPDHTSIQIGARSYRIPADATIYALHGTAKSTTGISLHLPDSVTDYTVAAGKKFIYLGATAADGTTSRQVTVEQSDDADASTNPVTLQIFQTATGNGLINHFPSTNMPSVPATKYVNVKVAATAGAYIIITAFGYEINV